MTEPVVLYRQAQRTAYDFGDPTATYSTGTEGEYWTLPGELRDPITVCGWFKVNRFVRRMGAFFGRGSLQQKEWSLYVSPSANDTVEISIEIQVGPNSSSGTNIGGNIPNAYGWHFIALVRKGDTWTAYVDDAAPNSRRGQEVVIPGSVWSIGFVPGMFLGWALTNISMADWRIWGAALTQQEIAAEREAVGAVHRPDLFAEIPRYPDLTVATDGGTATVRQSEGPTAMVKWGEVTLEEP